MKVKKRPLIEILVQEKIPDKKKALAYILSGKILVNGEKLKFPQHLIPLSASLEILSEKRFVSRGGEKLLSAIQNAGLENAFVDKTVLDIGASTGGFTDCLLQHGAKLVVAVDVGNNQLAWKLRTDPRVVSCENTHLENFPSDTFPPFDWVVGDCSFTSWQRLAPCLKLKIPTHQTQFLLLVKPQFELPASLIPQGGIVENPEHIAEAIRLAQGALEGIGLDCRGVFPSGVKGRSGNQEVFLLFSKKNPS